LSKTISAANTISGKAVPATRRARRTGRDGFGTQTPAQGVVAQHAMGRNIDEGIVARQAFCKQAAQLLVGVAPLKPR
jgi:hypothetical protein